eukprot:gene444-biopygen21135
MVAVDVKQWLGRARVGAHAVRHAPPHLRPASLLPHPAEEPRAPCQAVESSLHRSGTAGRNQSDMHLNRGKGVSFGQQRLVPGAHKKEQRKVLPGLNGARRCCRCDGALLLCWLPLLPPQGEQDTGAGVARAWRGRGAGCRQFLAWGGGAWCGHGAGVVRAFPVPPGHQTCIRYAHVGRTFRTPVPPPPDDVGNPGFLVSHRAAGGSALRPILPANSNVRRSPAGAAELLQRCPLGQCQNCSLSSGAVPLFNSRLRNRCCCMPKLGPLSSCG